MTPGHSPGRNRTAGTETRSRLRREIGRKVIPAVVRHPKKPGPAIVTAYRRYAEMKKYTRHTADLSDTSVADTSVQDTSVTADTSLADTSVADTSFLSDTSV